MYECAICGWTSLFLIFIFMQLLLLCLFVCVFNVIAAAVSVVRLIYPQNPTWSTVATTAFARFLMSLSISEAYYAAE